jgi:AbrB family looped-hinge helix DNA binding protein
VSHFTRIREKPSFNSGYISRVDSKGRITIPIGLRARLRLLEGSSVRIIRKGRAIVVLPQGD